MSEEKKKAQAIRWARRVQQGEGREVKDLQDIIAENEAAEAQLYAQRGYGSYISSDHIKAIRQTTWEAVQKIESLRKKAEQASVPPESRAQDL